MNMKKVLAAVLAGTMVMGGTVAVCAETIDNVFVGDFLSVQSAGIEVKAEELTMTFKGQSADTSAYYFCPNVILYTADEPAFQGTNYAEYVVIRADRWSWTPAGDCASYSGDTTWEVSGPDNDEFDAWIAALGEGMDFTVKAKLDGDKVVCDFTAGSINMKFTTPVDTSRPVYLSLSGEKCKMSDINYSYAGGDAAAGDDSSSGDGAAAGSDDAAAGTSDQKTEQTGDAAPIAAVVVALAGCAAIAFASKKRFVK